LFCTHTVDLKFESACSAENKVILTKQRNENSAPLPHILTDRYTL